MRNERPIFIVGMARGGSSVLLNILRSHPHACSPRGETHQVFCGKPEESYIERFSKLRAYLPIVIRQREHVFSIRRLIPRRPLSKASQNAIDKILYRDKLLATSETQNRYKSEGVEYTTEEVRQARLLCKNLNGLAYTTNLFNQMYPDATFFGLVRNGFAVCESFMRRGVSASAFGSLYRRVFERIADDAEHIPSFHLVRYETLAERTLETIKSVFRLADLDKSLVAKYRLVVDSDQKRTGGGAERLVWYPPQELERTISGEFNEKQIERLPKSARSDFLKEAGTVMERLGYL